MKKLLLLLAGTLAIAGAAPAVSQSEPTATITVNVTATGFVPDTVEIRPGDTVTWRNTDTQPHQIVSNTNAFPASPVLQPGQSYSYRFATAGAYSYHDGRRAASTGFVFVRAPGRNVYIGVTSIRAIFGSSVRVFGSIDSNRAEPVTVTITRYGGQTVQRTVTTDAEGTFEFTDKPPIRSEYRASWRNGESTMAPFVNVRPLVIFDVLNARDNLYRVRVRAQRSYRGKLVYIQRRTARGTWFTNKRVRLNARGEARFRGSFPRGRTHARAWVAQAPGYVVGFSVTKTISR